MLTDRDLQGLLTYDAKSPVLSVYLDTDPADGNAEVHRLRLRSMLKDVELLEDVQAVLRYFDHEHDWSGRSVAVFSCAPQGFMETYPLAMSIRSRVRISNRPHVKPLADILDLYGGYGVVLIDKQGARFFYFHLGELKEQEGVMGEDVRRIKQGGGSQSTGRRGGAASQSGSVDDISERNIKEAVDAATRFFSDNNVRRVLIGGTDDNVAFFRSQLPKAWQSLVVGAFPISMTASQSEVLEKAMEIGQEAEQRREAQLVKALVTNAAKGREGVLGLADTLTAIREGRVKTLFYRDSYRALGSRCHACGHLSAQAMETCSLCGAESAEVSDIVEVAVRQVMRAGGDVEVLRKTQELEGFDQIGALLRY